MSELDNQQPGQEQTEDGHVPKVSTLGDILEKAFTEPVKSETKESEKKATEEKKAENPEVKEDKKSEEQKVKNEESDEESELDIAREELKKTENARKKARDELSKVYVKVKNYEKKIAALVDDGSLDKDIAENLMSEIKHDAKFEEEEEKNISGFQKLLKTASQGLNKYRESMEEGFIDEDPLLDKKIEAFDHFMNSASHEEREEALDELEKLKEKPVLLAKKMLSIGEQYYDEVLREIDESGGIKNFKLKETREKEKLQKKVDKLEKELLRFKEQYENFIVPEKMSIPSGGSSSAREPKGYSMSEIINRAQNGTLKD